MESEANETERSEPLGLGESLTVPPSGWSETDWERILTLRATSEAL